MDVSMLYQAAARLGQAADLVRARAGLVRLQAAHAEWDSPGARAFADRLGLLVGGLLARAAEIDDLAERFRARAAYLAALP